MTTTDVTKYLKPGAIVPVDVQTTALLVNALREALAEQPAQQEPFGYFRYDLRLDAWVQNRAGLTGTPFYTFPPAQRKPLTLQERTRIVRANKMYHDKDEIDAYGVIDDVEAAHGIKEKNCG